jgi:hypothetical protein
MNPQEIWLLWQMTQYLTEELIDRLSLETRATLRSDRATQDEVKRALDEVIKAAEALK